MRRGRLDQPQQRLAHMMPQPDSPTSASVRPA
jgi:hypothetical protein